MVLDSRFVSIVTLIALLVVSSPAFSQKKRAEGGVGLDQAVSELRGRTNGRVLSAETRSVDGKPIHHIRVLTEKGKVKRYRLDGNTGRPLSQPSQRR